MATVANAGDVTLWTEAGLADLRYTLQASGVFSAPAGMFIEPPGGDANTHLISMDTTSPGVFAGTFTVFSDDPDAPQRTVQLVGEVLASGGCSADWNNDGLINSADISAFLTSWLLSIADGDLVADFNNDQVVNSSDISAFLSAWLEQLPGGC